MSEVEEKEQPTYSAAEQKARDSNWAPRDEWKGDEDDWVDYKEFNFRGELMGRVKEQSSIMHNLKNQVSESKKVIDDLKGLQKTISDREYKKALAALRAEKAEAVGVGDGDRVVELDEEIDTLKEKKTQVAQAAAAPAPIPAEITEWLGKPENQWYHQNQFLKDVADAMARDIRQNNAGIEPGALLRQVDTKLRKELPQHFPNRSSAVSDGSGDGQSSGQSRGNKPKYSDMTDEQQSACKRFEKTGVMTRQEYIDELVKAGDL